MDRRTLLVAMAASTVLALSACDSRPFDPLDPVFPPGTPTPTPSHLPIGGLPTPAPSATPPVTPTPTPPPAPVVVKSPIPGGTISAIPGEGNLLAWTVDDGGDSAVVAAYAKFVADARIRLTFFATGQFPSWTDNAPLLRPLVESGQVQMANHTWSHPDLTRLSDAGVVGELTRCDELIRTLYGVSAAPFYRPPFGYTDRRTRAVATSAGYRACTLWYGTLSDSGRITPEQVVQFANQWFQPQHIVIGHANFDPVTQVYGQLIDIIRERNLQTVTLNDVFQV